MALHSKRNLSPVWNSGINLLIKEIRLDPAADGQQLSMRRNTIPTNKATLTPSIITSLKICKSSLRVKLHLVFSFEWFYCPYRLICQNKCNPKCKHEFFHHQIKTSRKWCKTSFSTLATWTQGKMTQTNIAGSKIFMWWPLITIYKKFQLGVILIWRLQNIWIFYPLPPLSLPEVDPDTRDQAL